VVVWGYPYQYPLWHDLAPSTMSLVMVLEDGAENLLVLVAVVVISTGWQTCLRGKLRCWVEWTRPILNLSCSWWCIWVESWKMREKARQDWQKDVSQRQFSTTRKSDENWQVCRTCRLMSRSVWRCRNFDWAKSVEVISKKALEG